MALFYSISLLLIVLFLHLSEGFFQPQSRVLSTALASSSISSSPGTPQTVVSRCTDKIKSALQTDRVIVKASSDDPNGSHITVECISEEFEGKTTLQRQRLVYKAIWDEMQGDVHAVDSIVAKAPSEVAK
jgi:stress-induced morphogen